MALMSLQGLFSIFEIVAVTLDDKLFWRNVQQIPLYYSPVMILGVIMSFIGGSRRVVVRSMVTLSLIMLTYWILLFTDPQHHLIRVSASLEGNGQEGILRLERTHLGLLFFIFAKMMGLWGLGLLLINYRKVVGTQRTQHVLLMIAILSPFFVPELAGFMGIKVTVAVSMLPSGLLLFYALYKYNFLKVPPMVKEKVLEHLTEGILIVDEQGMIIDANPAALPIMARLVGDNKLRCTQLLPLLKNHPTLQTFYNNGNQDEIEVESSGRHWAVRFIPIQIRYKRTGSLLILRDITERKAYENELIKKSTLDGLTNLYNRRTFLEILDTTMKASRVSGESVSLLLIDLDNFKKINDTHGHLVGDRVLEHFAGLMRDAVRSGGAVGRIGGEEFAMVLPGSNGTQAYQAAEQLRLRLQQEPLRWVSTGFDREIAYTISIGVSELIDPFKTLEVWYHHADTCLYVSKNNGRNRTTLAG